MVGRWAGKTGLGVSPWVGWNSFAIGAQTTVRASGGGWPMALMSPANSLRPLAPPLLRAIGHPPPMAIGQLAFAGKNASQGWVGWRVQGGLLRLKTNLFGVDAFGSNL